MCHLLNFQKILVIRHVTNKIIINLKWRKCNNLCKPLIKQNIKHIKFNQFLNYRAYDNNEIKGFSKIRIKTIGTSWNWNMKDNFMTRYCHNCTFLDVVSFEHHKEFQIFWTCWKNLFFVKFTTMEFLKLSYINFETYFFLIFRINQ